MTPAPLPHVTAKPKRFAKAALITAVFAACTAVAAAGDAGSAADPWLRPSEVPAPADNRPSAARVELGKMLFFDPRLSGSRAMSCATCHNPSFGWSDGLPRAVGHGHKELGRNSPTILNTAYQRLQMWDGRKRSLEDQALGPIADAGEMNLPLEQLVSRLSAIAGYAPHFEAAYPGEGVGTRTVAKAIASFERSVVSTEAPFDRWRMGDDKAVSESAKRGFALFTGKANCAACHQGFNFSDNGFHNIGVRALSAGEAAGRFAHLPLPSQKGAFKTPTLRDVTLTAPYMRNGIYRTLDEVVEHYDRGGDDKESLSPDIKPLGLTAQEKRDLVALMTALTGSPTLIALPALPAK